MRRTLLLLTAMLVAALGTALIYAYVRGADSRAQHGAERVPVLVAAADVTAGTPPASIPTRRVLVAQSDLIPGAVSTLSGLTGQLTIGLLNGQQISTRAFGKASTTGLPAGDVAVGVTVAVADQAGGFLHVGDKVSVYTFGKDGAETVLPDGALVVKLGGGQTGLPPTTVVFGVTSADAKKLLTAGNGGRIVLTTVPVS